MWNLIKRIFTFQWLRRPAVIHVVDEEAVQQANMLRDAQVIATRLLALREGDKNAELTIMRLKNPTLHALVQAELEKLRQIANEKQVAAQIAVLEAMRDGTPGAVKMVDGTPRYVKGCTGEPGEPAALAVAFGGIHIGVYPQKPPREIRLGTGYQVIDNSSLFAQEAEAIKPGAVTKRLCHL